MLLPKSEGKKEKQKRKDVQVKMRKFIFGTTRKEKKGRKATAAAAHKKIQLPFPQFFCFVLMREREVDAAA